MTPASRSSRLRVARVIARLNVGGPAIHVASLTGRLDPLRFESQLFAGDVSPGEEEMSSVLDRERVHPIKVRGLGRAIHAHHDVIALQGLISELRRFQPHIVHTHTAKAGTLGRLAAKLLGIPIVVHTFHGHVFSGYFKPSMSRLFVEIERVLARWTDVIVALSPQQRLELSEHYRIAPRGDLYVIPLGFDLAPFVAAQRLRGQLRRELSLSDQPLVVIVGRITDIKDHALLLRAVALLDESVHLAIVGGGDRERETRELASSLGISARTHFLGFRSDLDRVLADTDVLALTSKNEGTPVAIIEALAAGCSVVATSVGGVSDVLQGGRLGHLATERAPAAVARALRLALAEHPNRRPSAVEEAREHVLKTYGIERLVSDHERLYEGLAKAAGLE